MIDGETARAFAYREPFPVEVVFGLELDGVDMMVAAIDGQGAVNEGDDECSLKHLAAFRKGAVQNDSFSMRRQRFNLMAGYSH